MKRERDHAWSVIMKRERDHAWSVIMKDETRARLSDETYVYKHSTRPPTQHHSFFGNYRRIPVINPGLI